MNYSEELCSFAHVLETKGLLTGLEGNVSVTDRESGLTYVTPSRRMKLLLQPDEIAVMDSECRQVGGSGKRSSEYLLHEAIYKAFPSVNAVIHSHCPWLTAYALAYRDFVVPESSSLRVVFRRFPCLPYGKGGTHEIHRGIEDALADSPICLLGGHGVVCVSYSLEDATGLLEAAEGFAKTLWISEHL